MFITIQKNLGSSRHYHPRIFITTQTIWGVVDIPAKNSKSFSFSTLLNHQNMILDGSENSWMVMSTTPQTVWVVMKILGW